MAEAAPLPSIGAALETFQELDIKDALIVVAFPTTGSASSIAANYLIRHLEIPLVGHIRAPDIAGVTAIQDGVATSAIRIFGGDVACRLDKKCPHIYLVTSDLPLPPALAGRVADLVLEWARRGLAYLVIALEGVVRGAGDETPDVFIASAQEPVLKELGKAGIKVMERAIIAGSTAHLLLAAPGRGVRAGAILVEATRDHPDGRAAAALLEAFAKVVPDVKMDYKPLLKEALKLEKEIRRAQESATPKTGPAPESFI